MGRTNFIRFKFNRHPYLAGDVVEVGLKNNLGPGFASSAVRSGRAEYCDGPATVPSVGPIIRGGAATAVKEEKPKRSRKKKTEIVKADPIPSQDEPDGEDKPSPGLPGL